MTPGDCLFETVKLIRNSDPHKYEHSGYSIGYDARSQLSNGEWNKHFILAVDNTLSVHADNKKED